MKKPKILVATPEIILGLESGMGNLFRQGINFSTGGMAPVNSKYILGLLQEGTFDTYAAVPKWESSLRSLSALTTKEIKTLEEAMPGHVELINHPSFNRVELSGSNTRMYEDTDRFTSVQRAIAFSSGITNGILPKLRPDIVWLSDWMVGPVAPVAKALGIKVVTTGHNIFTKSADFGELIDGGVELRTMDDYDPQSWIYWNHGQFDFMGSAINAADDFTTVSQGFLERILNNQLPTKAPTVIHAIQNKAQHPHADGRSRVHGYLNPLERDESELLDCIRKHDVQQVIEQRKDNSLVLRERVNLREGGDLLIFPNRMYKEQKNPELLIDNATYLARKYNVRILFLGNGDEAIVQKAKEVAARSNGLVAYHTFDKKIEELAKRSDGTYAVMTSEYEPCGGPNLNYPLEGALVIGHAVDGIKDTVHELGENTGNGFPYLHNDLQGLEYAIGQMKKFSALPDEVRYEQYIRIAKETLQNHSSKARISHLVSEIFLPLYEEKF